MPTKEELLEGKTVKELRQMARDKDLSGYSEMRKPELMETIEDSYLKDEIKAWPELGLSEVGWGKRIGEEKREPKTRVPTEEMKVDESFGRKQDLVYIALVLGSTAASIAAVVALYLYL